MVMSETFEILVIDDDPITRKLLAKGLSKEAWTLRDTGTAGEALEALEEMTPQLILLDWHLPGMDGGEFLVRLSELKLMNRFEVFLLTADRMDEDAEFKFASIGISEFFYKPLDMTALKEAVKRVHDDWLRGAS